MRPPVPVIRALAHALVVSALIFVPSLWLLPPPVWRLPFPTLVILATFVVGYLAATLLLERTSQPRTDNQFARAIIVGVVMFGICLAVVWLLWWRSPRLFAGDLPVAALATSVLLGVAALVLMRVFDH